MKMKETRMGRVKFFNQSGQYGIVQSGYGEYFFHLNDGHNIALGEFGQPMFLKGKLERVPEVGNALRFIPGQNAKGLKAVSWGFEDQWFKLENQLPEFRYMRCWGNTTRQMGWWRNIGYLIQASLRTLAVAVDDFRSQGSDCNGDWQGWFETRPANPNRTHNTQDEDKWVRCDDPRPIIG